MKKTILVVLLIPALGIAQLNKSVKKEKIKITNSIKNTVPKTNISNSNIIGLDIAAGLKEALNQGISEQVSKLTAIDGFYKNENVKIQMPSELENVEKTLRKIGMGNLVDEGIKSMNRAAEDAVKEATPIFISAIINMSISDAKTILLGNENAATAYLQKSTTKDLYAKLYPVVQQSMGKVGSDVIWTTIIDRYNSIPFVSKANPDISNYITNKALDGVFKMITIEEINIRSNLKSRTTNLLQNVFSLQDKK